MNTAMNGKQIEFVDLDPAWTQHGNPERIGGPDGTALHLSATFHGDHEQYWIIQSVKGQEIARYSWRAVQHIRWQQLEKSPCCAFEGCPNPPEEHEGGYCRDHK